MSDRRHRHGVLAAGRGVGARLGTAARRDGRAERAAAAARRSRATTATGAARGDGLAARLLELGRPGLCLGARGLCAAAASPRHVGGTAVGSRPAWLGMGAGALALSARRDGRVYPGSRSGNPLRTGARDPLAEPRRLAALKPVAAQSSEDRRHRA